MTIQEQIDILRKQRDAAIVDAIRSMEKSMADIAIEHHVCLATVRNIAREFKVRRTIDHKEDGN